MIGQLIGKNAEAGSQASALAPGSRVAVLRVKVGLFKLGSGQMLSEKLGHVFGSKKVGISFTFFINLAPLAFKYFMAKNIQTNVPWVAHTHTREPRTTPNLLIPQLVSWPGHWDTRTGRRQAATGTRQLQASGASPELIFDGFQ